MIPFEQEFEHLQARMLFGMNKFQISWELGKPMPPDLPDRIVEAMQSQGRISIAPGGPAVRLTPVCLGAHLLRLLCAGGGAAHAGERWRLGAQPEHAGCSRRRVGVEDGQALSNDR